MSSRDLELAELFGDDPPTRTCIFCSLPVLGLAGQDQMLDTFDLVDTDEAFQAEAWGECHSACLLSTKWGQQWAKLRLRSETRRGRSPLIYRDAEFCAFRNEVMKYTNVVCANGEYVTILDSDLDRIQPTAGGWLIPMTEKVSWNLVKMVDAVRDLKQELKRSRVASLWTFLTALGLRDAVLHPVALQSGRLKLVPELEQYWSDSWITVRISHFRFVRESILSKVFGRPHGKNEWQRR
ncbi:MAG: hypothetical protein V4719_29080 [Planctomycetota bacterium]